MAAPQLSIVGGPYLQIGNSIIVEDFSATIELYYALIADIQGFPMLFFRGLFDEKFKILTASVLMLCTSNSVIAGVGVVGVGLEGDVSPITDEYVADNPGLETVVPSWTRVDHDVDGKVDGYDFHFDVYRLGTKTKLFSTPVQYLPYTVIPCDDLYSLKPGAFKNFNLTRIGKNIVLSVYIYADCTKGLSLYYSHETVHVYAVNISTAGKTPWVKSFSGALGGTGIVPDKNGNGTGELSVIIETKATKKGSNKDYTIYIYDGETGAQLATPQKYAIER